MTARCPHGSFLAVLVAGCAVGPDYVRPDVPAPAAFAAIDDERIESGAAIVTDWWTTLGDSRLVDLVRLAAVRNHDVRIAAARVREARASLGVAGAAALPEVDASSQYQGYRLAENGPGGRGLPPGR